MSDFVQKLDMKRADYPKKIPVSGFGERATRKVKYLLLFILFYPLLS